MESKEGNSHTATGDKKSTIEFNPFSGRKYLGYLSDGRTVVNAYVPPAGGLGHELKHAYNNAYFKSQRTTDLRDFSKSRSTDFNLSTFPNEEEYKTSMLDNGYLGFYGYGSRKSYTIDSYEVESSTSNKPIVTSPLNPRGTEMKMQTNNNQYTWSW